MTTMMTMMNEEGCGRKKSKYTIPVCVWSESNHKSISDMMDIMQLEAAHLLNNINMAAVQISETEPTLASITQDPESLCNRSLKSV